MHRSKAKALLCTLAVACGGGESDPAMAPDATGSAATETNRPPVIEQVLLEPLDPRPGQRLTVDVRASDPDGEKVRFDYRWRVDGQPIQSADGKPSLHVEGHPRGSLIEVSVVARDAGGESEPRSASVRVQNVPPSIVQVDLHPSGEAHAGVDIQASPSAVDLDGDEITYRFHWEVNGETIEVDGPTLPSKHFEAGDAITLEVVASDDIDESEPVRSRALEVKNGPPRIVSKPGAIGADGLFRYAVRAEDPDGAGTLRYRLLKGPEGMTIGFDDGMVYWDPSSSPAGVHEIEIAVEDRKGARATQGFTLDLSFQEGEAPPANAEEDPKQRD